MPPVLRRLRCEASDLSPKEARRLLDEALHEALAGPRQAVVVLEADQGFDDEAVGFGAVLRGHGVRRSRALEELPNLLQSADSFNAERHDHPT